MNNKEASDIIEAALNQVLHSLEDYEESDIVTDWVLVAHTANPEKEKGGGYPMFYSNGNLADYRARGLLTTGLIFLEYGQIADLD
jgi:hypothetical protein